MARPRGHHGSGDDDPSGPRRHGPAPEARSVAHGQEITAEIARRGRAGGGTPPPSPASPDDIQLNRMLDTLGKLGDEPPTVNIAGNDAMHEKAHTLDRHGPDIPLQTIPGTKTIEGRIYNGQGWERAENQSFRWTDHTTMNRTINDYVRRNWDRIRNDLAEDGSHEDVYDAGHRVGEGFVNKGMYGAGPRQARYAATSMIKVRIRLAPGSDPPQPFILTAYPVGIP